MPQFKGEEVVIKFDTYFDGTPAIRLLTKEGLPYMTASVNMGNRELLKEGEIFIKDYSENEGVLDFLENEGIVKRTGAFVRRGFVEIKIAKLIKEGL